MQPPLPPASGSLKADLPQPQAALPPLPGESVVDRISSPTQAKGKGLPMNRTPWFFDVLPWVFALIGTIFTFAITVNLHTKVNAEHAAQLSRASDRFQMEVENRLREPMNALMDASAAMRLNEFNTASPTVSRDQFQLYSQARRLSNEASGIRGMAYIQRIEKTDDQAFIESVRQADGLPEFGISSLEQSADLTDRYVVRHIEPIEKNRRAHGFDIGSETRRRRAIELAVASGTVTLSEPIVLVQDEKRTWGSLMLQPVYKAGMAPEPTPEQRREALQGILVAIFSIPELMGSHASSFGGVQFELKVLGKDGLQTTVYDSSGATVHVDNERSLAKGASEGSQEVFSEVSFGGLRFSIRTHFENDDATGLARYLQLGAFLLGLCLSVLIGLLTRSVCRAQASAQAQAHKENKEMASQIKRLAMVAEKTTNGVCITDTAKRIVWVNQSFERITGYRQAEIMGKVPGALLQCELTNPVTIRAIGDALRNAIAFKGKMINRHKDGQNYLIDIEIQPLRNDRGEHEGFMSITQDVTEEHASKESLVKERHRLASIIDATNAGTWEWNIRTGEIRFNERWAIISGFTLSQAQAMPIEQWALRTRPEDVRAASEKLKRHLCGETAHFECAIRMRKKNDEWIWLMTHGRLVSRTADGRPEWITGTHQDITEKKEAQDSFARSALLLRGAIDAIGEAFAIYDPQDRLIFFNDKYCETYEKSADLHKIGTPFEAIIRHGISQGQYPEALGREEEWAQERLTAHRQENYVGIQKLSDGRVIKVVEQRLADGHTVGFRMDITELFRSRELAQKAQQASEKALARLKAMYDVLPVGLSVVDKQGRVIDCNATAESMLQSTKEEIIRRFPGAGAADAWQVFNEDGHSVQADDYVAARALGANCPIYGSVVQLHLKGAPVWLSISAMPVEDESMGAVVAMLDVTEQRAQNKALIDAKHFAEQASKSKSQFLANMSHEIRTPMNAILGMLALLRRTEMSLRQAEYAAKTEGAARSLLGLLNDILDFSKVEAGKMTLDTQVFEVDSVLQNLSVILSANASGKQIELVYEIDPALPKHLIGDAMRLQQIMINLGGNAVKFTKQGEIVISVRCLGKTRDQVKVEFSIRDHGIGIAPENQGKIFEGFTQAEASTTRRYGGTGLGVAICQRLIALMGGRLELESELGRGSRFFFQIDLSIGTAQSLARQNEDALCAEDAEATCPLVVRTLIIDDSPTARRSLETSVRSLGWTSQSVDSGEKALELVRSHPHAFDMVLVDWTMPGMNGWETCKRLKLDGSGLGAAKLFMVTAQGRDMLATRSRQEQDMLTGFVVKPVTPKMLSEARKTALLEESLKMGICYRSGPGDPAPLAVRRLEGVRILLAEDNVLNQQVARELLEHEGAHLETVGNGLAAVVALGDSATAYDVVLMDLQMPVMDGLSATQRIRTELGLTALPIIAMTANAMDHDREACLQGGMNAHVGKPFDLDHLVRTILSVTGKIGKIKLLKPQTLPAKARSVSQEALDRSRVCGVDLAAALARMGGNVPTYSRLLRNFLDDLPVVQAAMRAGLSRGEYALLTRHAHTVKGLCGTLGITTLADLSSESEAIFRNQDALACELQLKLFLQSMGQFSALLETFSKSISDLKDEQAPCKDAPRPPANRQAMVQCVKNLCALLKEVDMEAVTAIERMRTLDWGEKRAEIESIDNDVIALKFEDALIKCTQFLNAHD